MCAKLTDVNIERQGFEPEGLHPQTLGFLQSVARDYISDPVVLEALSPQDAVALADRLIDAQFSDYYARNRHPKWRAVARDRSSMAKRYVRGESSADISADYDNLGAKIVEMHIEEIPAGLHKAARQERISIAHIIGPTLGMRGRDVSPKSPPEGIQYTRRAGHLALVAPPTTATQSSPYEQWLEARDSHRRLLFGDSLAQSASAESLAQLAMRSNLAGRYRGEAASKAAITRNVSRILTAHELRAREDEMAIFSFANPNRNLDRLSSLTAGVVWAWDRACNRQDRPSPFTGLRTTLASSPDFGQTDVQLVVEATAGIVEVLQAGYPGGAAPGTRVHQQLLTFIALRGPDFARRWIRGEHIGAYCVQHQLDADYWLHLIGRRWRADIAIGSPRDPIGAVERVMQRFASLDTEGIKAEMGVSDADIAQGIKQDKNPSAALAAIAERRGQLTLRQIQHKVGWSRAEVRAFFTKGLIKRIARGNTNPLERVHEIAHAYEHTLAITQLIDHFGLSEEWVRIIFTESRRKELAVGYTAPLPAAQDIVELASELSGQYVELPKTIVAELATRNTVDAHALAKQLLKEESNRPQHISKALWYWTIVADPHGSHDQWLEDASAYIVQYRDWIQFMRTRGSQPPSDDSLDKRVLLRNLAQQAGIPPRDLETLLAYFADPKNLTGVEEAERSPLIAPLLEKLRQAGGRQRRP